MRAIDKRDSKRQRSSDGNDPRKALLWRNVGLASPSKRMSTGFVRASVFFANMVINIKGWYRLCFVIVSNRGGWAQEPRGYSPRWLWRHRAGQRARRPPGRWWTRWSGSESKSAGRQRSLGLTCWRRWCGNWRQYLQENFYIFGINNSNIQRMTTWAKYFNMLKHLLFV